MSTAGPKVRQNYRGGCPETASGRKNGTFNFWAAGWDRGSGTGTGLRMSEKNLAKKPGLNVNFSARPEQNCRESRMQAADHAT